jgi:hypothetical protein
VPGDPQPVNSLPLIRLATLTRGLRAVRDYTLFWPGERVDSPPRRRVDEDLLNACAMGVNFGDYDQTRTSVAATSLHAATATSHATTSDNPEYFFWSGVVRTPQC